MEDQESKKKGENPSAGGHGIGVPAKGDSSASNPFFDTGETISDGPSSPAPPPAKPNTRAANPDATLLGSLPAAPPRSRGYSGIHVKQDLLQPGEVIGGR